ncbi:recombinase zinc beta ribbon domain-containing protein [Candidatus Falkowbacteria bacterium]|nr:recombinase zinc beta ribbon domain-containing protein [Candidatus Falkowbacteria bacterium]
MEGLLAIFARIDNKIKSDRAKANMEALLLTGISPWKLPIGYRNLKNKEHGKKKTAPDPIDPERFPIIQRGLKEYVTGVHTINSLTKQYREWGLTTRSGKTIYPQMVERMLTDITYAGWLPNPWGDEPVRGLHTPAITLDEYHKIQLIKAGKSFNHAKPRERANEEFPLRNFARCAVCKTTLTGSGSRGRGGRYAYYHCKKRGCQLYGKTIPKEDLEADFIALLERVKPTEDAIKLFREIALDKWETKHKEYNADAERLQEKVDELNGELRELISMKSKNLITEEQFLEQKYPLDEATIAAKVALSEARIEEWDIEAAVSYATQFMTDLPRQWRDYSLQQKHQFQHLVFPEGVIYKKGEGVLELKLGAIYQLLQDITTPNFDLVPSDGIEPPFYP